MITYSNTLYKRLEHSLGMFERQHLSRQEETSSEQTVETHDVILFGLGRYGALIAEYLRQEGYKFLGVDFNPDVVRGWQKRGYSALYGDVYDQDFIHLLPLDSVKWVISAIPQFDVGVTREDPRLVLISALKQRGFAGTIAVATQDETEIPVLQAKGADLVFLPYRDAARQAVDKLKEAEARDRDHTAGITD
jgi:Trk K+ transport system NAD-binding subunit